VGYDPAELNFLRPKCPKSATSLATERNLRRLWGEKGLRNPSSALGSFRRAPLLHSDGASIDGRRWAWINISVIGIRSPEKEMTDRREILSFHPFRTLSTMLSLTRRLAPSVLQARRLVTGPPPLGNPPPRELSEGEQVIHGKLIDRFTPSELLVQDISGE